MPTQAIAADTPSQTKLIIEDADADSVACGLTDDVLRSAMLAAMRYNRISQRTASDPNDMTSLYLSASTLEVGPVCVTSYHVNFYGYGEATVAFFEHPLFSFVELGEHQSMISTDRTTGEHATRVTSAIKESVDLVMARVAKRVEVARERYSTAP